MQLHPTRTAVDLAIAGIGIAAAGVVFREPAVLAWGGALLLGLAVARAVTLLSVTRIRSAGFEMLWRRDERVRRVSRGDSVELAGELRNRDSRAARYVALRPVASPELDVQIDPDSGEVPASGRLAVTVTVRASRVGRHGVHGLSLEVQGSPGLFEVPLTFANPYGIEVMPASFATRLVSARGGRSRMTAESGRAGPLAGEGMELRELREHQPGDPFKRIAWKATARRGKLMVRDYEREERDVVWLVLDASVELWAGEPGTAPLDAAIDQVAAVAARHLAAGDRVGLAIVGERVLCQLEPDRGPQHGAAIMTELALSTGTLDADRSDLDEGDVALRVLEHMRPLEPSAAARVRAGDLDRIARRAERVRQRAPFDAAEPKAASRRERGLRRYLAEFGIGSPARTQSDRDSTLRTIADLMVKVARRKPRPSAIYLWMPPPETSARRALEDTLARIPRRHVELRWLPMDAHSSLPRGDDPVTRAVSDALAVRLAAARRRAERALRRLGVRPVRLHQRRPMPDANEEHAA